jgi:ssDNA-binding replication factor A large subunit
MVFLYRSVLLGRVTHPIGSAIMVYDFDSLLDEVLRNRPEVTREQIMRQIQEKKRDVGAGFLTDQGALFLIAGELGVPLKQMTSTDLTLKDIYAGANDITVVARVLSVYPISEYKRKDGTVGRYRRLVLFDGANVGRLTIWDDNERAVKLDGISPDTPVRVSNAYVRPGLDGKPSLNLGKRGKIEVLVDEKLVSRLATISKLTKGIGEVEDDQGIVAVRGTTISASRSSNFTRSDGSAGSLAQFEITDDSGKNRIRVVVWNPVAIEVGTGQRVIVTNLRVRKSSSGERELHGDSGTVVQVPGRGDGRLLKVAQVKEAAGPVGLEVMVLSKSSTHDVTMKDGSIVRKTEIIVGDDTGEITLVGWRALGDGLVGIEVGQKVRVSGLARQMSKMGIATLELTENSKIEKVQS